MKRFTMPVSVRNTAARIAHEIRGLSGVGNENRACASYAAEVAF